MEVMRAIGNRAFQEYAFSTSGADCLVAHACFRCRKSWKRPESATGSCPQCAGPLHWMGRAFAVPKKTDIEQWATVEALWKAGFRFHAHTRWREVLPYPKRLRDVVDFVAAHPEHPFRVR